MDAIAQSKRNELIIRMQGTKDNPYLKELRKELLNIKTSSELAEILDITRPTMSKLEKCINKLSAAQYLAICALLEKRKNEILQQLTVDSLNDEDFGKLIRTLYKMSFFYKDEFISDMLNIIDNYQGGNIDKIKENVASLQKYTCLDSWLECRLYKDIIPKNEEKNIYKNSLIYIDMSSYTDIENITNLFDKYSQNNKSGKGLLCFEYNNIIAILEFIQKEILKGIDFAENKKMIDFVIKFSLLKKENKIRIVNNRNTFNKMTDSTELVFVTNDEEMANQIKTGVSVNVFLLSENLLNDIAPSWLKTPEICMYEDEKFKRWIFDFEYILKKKEEYLKKYHNEFEDIKTFVSGAIQSNEEFPNQEEFIDKFYNAFDEQVNHLKLSQDNMEEKLEILLSKILQYLTPNSSETINEKKEG